MSNAELGQEEKPAPVQIVLACMPQLLERIVRDLLHGQHGIRIQDGVTSLQALRTRKRDQSAVVVIEADPPEFADACAMLPGVRLVGIAHDWRQAAVRFSFHDLSRERLRDAIRCVAGEVPE